MKLLSLKHKHQANSAYFIQLLLVQQTGVVDWLPAPLDSVHSADLSPGGVIALDAAEGSISQNIRGGEGLQPGGRLRRSPNDHACCISRLGLMGFARGSWPWSCL